MTFLFMVLGCKQRNKREEEEEKKRIVITVVYDDNVCIYVSIKLCVCFFLTPFILLLPEIFIQKNSHVFSLCSI